MVQGNLSGIVYVEPRGERDDVRGTSRLAFPTSSSSAADSAAWRLPGRCAARACT
jgi:hypothetical protein